MSIFLQNIDLSSGSATLLNANMGENTFNKINELKEQITAGEHVINISGLSSTASKAFFLNNLREAINKPVVVVTADVQESQILAKDIAHFSRSANSVVEIPNFEANPYSGTSPHAETQERRAEAFWRLLNESPHFVILPIRSLITRIPAPDKFRSYGTIIRRDEDLRPEEFTKKLFDTGYRVEEPISNIGEFSVRGGILDVWSPDSENPIRIEFFGDSIDSIRSFNPATQLSIEQLTIASVAPMREFKAGSETFKLWANAADAEFTDSSFSRNLRDRTEFASSGEEFPGWEFLISLIEPNEGTVFDYLKDAVIIIDEPGLIESHLETFYTQIRERYEEILDDGEIGLAPERLFLDEKSLRTHFTRQARIEFRALGLSATKTDQHFSIDGKLENKEARAPLFLFPAEEAASARELTIQARPTRKFHGDLRGFASELKKMIELRRNDLPEFVFESKGLAERFGDILRDYDLVVPDKIVSVGRLSGGFEIPEFKKTIYTENEVFGEIHRDDLGNAAARRTKPRTSAFISDFRDLKPGDFVVHVDHGIGRFEGLQTIGTQGIEREFMLLIYANDSKLFVPVERLDLVSRYGSAESIAPTLDRLGGLGWQKTKAKAKRAMRDMADELLRLYAERKLVKGFAFSKDAPWQTEFEDAFPYTLTPDQDSAVKDVKSDMETAVPMDRLIIGDVGYGKTEVAMRAAFKAVMDGKQVAVLTPTTILAYQHFENFKERFVTFPVKIELLSRFRSRKEQKTVVEKSEKGEVDILIGTHRILSADVKLPKLGLVVVDEEQRFGVAHKEKLKKLKKRVDVVTLTATPIPRTLNMSLIGMRDMSVIETPPRDRLAIHTQVVQFSEGVIKSAIETELARNGQVFFLHNRVQTIETIAAHIKRIVPDARIAIGHGQMTENALERVMLDFVDYKFDVLIATTIIENGIDIPRANTIIINRSDNYGLSQLYQLRGRVGRSSRRAYAYLLIPPEQELTPIARRRLSAIREFSDLGAGFRIAALDLELRGAGSVLSGEQSGHLDSLGFDLYTKMLNRTIQELRGDEIEDETSVSLNFGLDVSIPREYIGETGQRLRTYKRISSAETEDELRKIYVELQDRYGALPASVENLFEYSRLRQLAEVMRVVGIDKTTEGIAIKLSEDSKISPEKLMKLVETEEDTTFSPNGILRVADNNVDPIEFSRRILEDIRI